MEIKNCYDFPLAVLHRSSGDCPRYAGGVCVPLPTPTRPYSDEEAFAVRAYQDLVSGKVAREGDLAPVEAQGRTMVDGEVVPESSVFDKAALLSGQRRTN